MTNEPNKNISIFKIKGQRMAIFINNYFIIFFALRLIVCHFYKIISFLFMAMSWRLAASFIRFIFATFVKFTLNCTKYIGIVRL